MTMRTIKLSRNACRTLICLGAGILAAAAARPVAAQVDYRIDYRTGSNGRLFDANNRVGSGGINRSNSSSRYPYGTYANNIVTGNVTGLGAFKGYSAIPGVNEFRVGLQSDSLSGFRARSVNIQQVQSGRTLGPSTYYDPSNTIADVGAIRYGLNQTGSSVLSSPQVTLPTDTEQGVRDRLLGIDDYGSRQINTGDGLDSFNVGRTTLRPVVSDAGAGNFAGITPRDPYRSAMQSTLFGTPDFNRDALLTPAAPPSNRPGRDGRIATSLNRDELLGVLDGKNAGDLLIEPTDGISPSPIEDGTSLTAPFGSLVRGIGRTDKPVAPGAAPESGQDELYGRMVDAVNQIQSVGGIEGFMSRETGSSDGSQGPLSGIETGRDRSQASLSPNAPDGFVPGGLRDNAVESSSGKTSQDPAGASQFDPRTEWARLFMDTPIRSFALTETTDVGKYMGAAEQAMKAGKFNQAIRMFDLAAMVDPDSPLPRLGRGHAQIAAGQYMSAVHSLTTGLSRFPQIAAFQLDLPSLTGQTDVFDRRRADLESILNRHERYELRFLLGYIELYSGLQYDGLNDLKKAAGGAPPDSIIAEFPDLLMGRKPSKPAISR